MASSGNNILTRNYSGKVGDQYVMRTRGKKSIIAGLPKKRKLGADALSQMESIKRKFSLAVIYARKAITNPALKEEYAAVRRGNQSAFNVAFLDAYKAPELADLRTDGFTGVAGQSLVVQAIDNFRVTKVSFALSSPDGKLLEEGEAMMDENGYDWIYTTQSDIPSPSGTIIRITAEDIPKNRSLLEAVI